MRKRNVGSLYGHKTLTLPLLLLLPPRELDLKKEDVCINRVTATSESFEYVVKHTSSFGECCINTIMSS